MGMLCLSRATDETIVLRDKQNRSIATIRVNKISRNRISIGIDADAEVNIIRGEVDDAKSGRSATGSGSERIGDALSGGVDRSE